MTSEPPTLTRRSFLSAAVAGIVSGPIWAKAITARVSDSQFLSDIEHRTFFFYWERVNHRNGLMADRWSGAGRLQHHRDRLRSNCLANWS